VPVVGVEPSRLNKEGKKSGGEMGIRTPDTLSDIHAFQACAFNRSAISPQSRRAWAGAVPDGIPSIRPPGRASGVRLGAPTGAAPAAAGARRGTIGRRGPLYFPMRIIGGSLRGRRIEAPRGFQVRPSSDRLRETLFNILGPGVAGRAFLDAFAGSGAVGLEAYSRGARPVR